MNTWRVGVPGLLSWSVLNTWYNNNNTIIYIYYTKYNVNNNIINVVIIEYIVLVSALSLVSNGPSYQSFVRELFRCITLCRSASVFSYYHVISCDHFPWFLLRGGVVVRLTGSQYKIEKSNLLNWLLYIKSKKNKKRSLLTKYHIKSKNQIFELVVMHKIEKTNSSFACKQTSLWQFSI